MSAATTIPVSSITSGLDLFHCEPYNCKLLAKACVERQTVVRAGLRRAEFEKCRDCKQGAEVQRQSGVVIVVETVKRGYWLERRRDYGGAAPSSAVAVVRSDSSPPPALPPEPKPKRVKARPVPEAAPSEPEMPQVDRPQPAKMHPRDGTPSPTRVKMLLAIAAHVAQHGFPPTLRELGASVGIRSTNAVMEQLNRLERDGYIVRSRDAKSRGITLTQKAIDEGYGSAPQPKNVDVLDALKRALAALNGERTGVVR